jgi:hypothetical protein
VAAVVLQDLPVCCGSGGGQRAAAIIRDSIKSGKWQSETGGTRLLGVMALVPAAMECTPAERLTSATEYWRNVQVRGSGQG